MKVHEPHILVADGVLAICYAHLTVTQLNRLVKAICAQEPSLGWVNGIPTIIIHSANDRYRADCIHPSEGVLTAMSYYSFKDDHFLPAPQPAETVGREIKSPELEVAPCSD